MMSEIVKAHDYEDAKKRIKDFSNNTTTTLGQWGVNNKKGVGEWIGDFLLGGGIGISHKVTGKELNALTEEIQNCFIDINNTQIKLIKEFGDVYIALDALDREHISGILASIKATEKTSERIAETQVQIQKIVDDQKKTLVVLQKFKLKLDDYAHLTDIDKIWNDCQNMHKEIQSLNYSVNETAFKSNQNENVITEIKQNFADADSKITQISENLTEQIARIENLISFMNELEKITHLRDIDDIWNYLTNASVTLKTLCEEIDTTQSTIVRQQQDIQKLLDFVKTTSEYEHLKDVDVMWDKVEDNSKTLESLKKQNISISETVKENKITIDELVNYKQELSSVAHLKDVDNLWVLAEKNSKQIVELKNQSEQTNILIQNNKDLVAQTLATEKETTDAVLEKINKKIQFAYWIAGGSVALALVELIIILLGL